MKKNITISIGICAYNEEQNIKSVINNALLQKQEGWTLSEVLVYSDGSTDQTENKVKSIKSNHLKLIVGKNRLGKTRRLNQLFRDFSSNILIVLDADIKLKDENVVTKIVQEFKSNNAIMLVGGNSTPIRPKTFFQKAVYSTFKVFYASRINFRGGHNVFGCTGSILGIRSAFAKKLTLPAVVNEDAYMYLKCKEKGYEFRYVDSAVIYYKLPENVKDYVRQVLRSEPTAVSHDLSDYFKDIESELRRPLFPYVRNVIKEFFINPLGVSLMITLNFACLPFMGMIQKKYSLNWFTATSTKNL